MMRAQQLVAVVGLTGIMLWSTGPVLRAQASTAAPAKPTPAMPMAAKPAAAKPAAGSAVARGKYLVTVMLCNDCHTPWKMGDNGPEPDMTRMLSGHPADMALPPPPQPSGPWIIAGAASFTAWAGPWGTSYTANLTPDKETGLGSWTVQQFVDTIRNGRVQGHGRQLLPPMPWEWIKNLTDADLKAVFAYLQSIPPIKNKVPDPVIAPPPAH